MDFKLKFCIAVFFFLFLSSFITITYADCNGAKTVFVNTSTNFTVDIAEYTGGFLRSLIHLFKKIGDLEVYRLQPRRMIFSWARKGGIQGMEYQNRIAVNEDKLTIYDIQASDAGTYSVEIPRSSANFCFKLYVMDFPNKPVITTIPPSNETEEGASLNLNCSSSSTTQPTDHGLKLKFSWRVDGERIQSDERYKTDGQFLRIDSISRNDAKRNITCVVEEENGLSNSSTYSLNVFWGPALILELDPPNSVYTLRYGDVVPTTVCKADCFPACNITWRKVKGNMAMLYENKLNLGYFEASKAGEYMCTATRQGTHKMGFRTVNIQIQERAYALREVGKQTTSNTVLVGGILGTLLFVTFVIIGVLFTRILRSERTYKANANLPLESTTLQTTTDNNMPTYEGLDGLTRNQHIYDSVKKDADPNYTNMKHQSTVYDN